MKRRDFIFLVLAFLVALKTAGPAVAADGETTYTVTVAGMT